MSGVSEEIGHGLSEVMAVVGPLYRRATRSLGSVAGTASPAMSVGTRAVLELLAATEAQPVPRVAERLELSRQFVQRSVDEGLTAGLLALLPNPAHQRSSLVGATPAGRHLLHEVTCRERALLTAAGAELTSEQVKTCTHVLRTMLTKVAWD